MTPTNSREWALMFAVESAADLGSDTADKVVRDAAIYLRFLAGVMSDQPDDGRDNVRSLHS